MGRGVSMVVETTSVELLIWSYQIIVDLSVVRELCPFVCACWFCLVTLLVILISQSRYIH